MKTIIISITIAVLLMAGAFILSIAGKSGVGSGGVENGFGAGGVGNRNVGTSGTNVNVNSDGSTGNVSIVDGKQIIIIDVKGGYNPEKSVAKAGIPTVIRFVTRGTFDCSSFIRIPSLNVSQALPQTGSTDVSVGSQQAGVLNGTCGMGMYRFNVEFK